MNGSELMRRARGRAAGVRRRSAGDGVPISIVVPARNVEVTVAKTIESVFAQTSDRWELVIIDDGSTDDTRKIVDELVAGRANVTVADGPSMGVSAARNLGTELARHDYVLYLDADDWIGPRFVELMGEAAAADPELAGIRCIWAYETPDGRWAAWDDLDLSDLFGVSATRCPFAIHACIVKRDLVLELGGFDLGLVVGEDWDVWQRIGRAGGRFGFVQEAMAFYLMRPESVMHQDFVRSQTDLVEVTRRGHRADDRVPNPLPRYADGVSATVPKELEAEVLSGTLAGAIPTETDLAELMATLDIPSPGPTAMIDPDLVASTMHEAVAFGSCALLADWPELYTRWSDRIHEMLDLYTNWLEQPTLKDEILLCLEEHIVELMPVDDALVLGRTTLKRIDLGRPIPDVTVEDGTVQVVAAVWHGQTPIGFVTLRRVEGSVLAADLADVIARHLGLRALRKAGTDLSLAARVAPNLLRPEVAKGAARLLLDVSWDPKSGAKATTKEFLRWTGTQAVANMLDVPLRLDPWIREEPSADAGSTIEADAAAGSATTADQTDVGSEGEHRVDPDRRQFDDQYGEEYFDSIFEEENPWSYTGDYEQTKYEQTLDLLGDRRFENALELACAEGHFTVQLAPRVDRLFAADISPTALERAAERCAAFDHITYGQIDLRGGELPSDLDLIVCSEVLYFMDSEENLADLGRRFAAALRPGGRVLMAHANLIVDDPDKTGFEWGQEFGARRIGEILAEASPDLRLVTVHKSELYRIHLFERVEAGAPVAEPVEVEIPMAENLDTHIRRMALWGGAVTSRVDAMAEELAYQIPILMYHRVAPEGNPALDAYRVTPETFERQLEYLRAHGYYSIGFDSLRYALSTKTPLPGRPVLITFDDGYVDFEEYAWPLLVDYDFSATNFIVADLVGTEASWDRRFGEVAPLMDWDSLRKLQANGLEIGSHSAAHRTLSSLTESDLLADEHRAKAIFRRELGIDVRTLAYPFGAYDEMVEVASRKAGYDLAVTTKGWLATVWHDPMMLPRVDIVEADEPERFGIKLGTRGGVNPIRQGIREVRSAIGR